LKCFSPTAAKSSSFNTQRQFQLAAQTKTSFGQNNMQNQNANHRFLTNFELQGGQQLLLIIATNKKFHEAKNFTSCVLFNELVLFA
jgi:hypothetical protein